MKGDQFRVNDLEFEIISQNIYDYSVNYATELSISPATIAKFTALYNPWVSCWAISKMSATANNIDKENTKTAKKGLTDFIRKFVKKQYYDNDLATDTDIVGAGLVIHSKKHSPVVFDNTEIPRVRSNPLAGRMMQFICRNNESKKAKPKGARFFKVCWHLGPDAPNDPKDFDYSEEFSKQPIVLSFKVADIGKELAVAICYVTNKAKVGSYCPIIHLVVPA